MPADDVIDGRYQILSPLGRGGMGEVLRVLDLTTDRELALKRMILPDGDRRRRSAARAILRFEREFHTLASLSHPRIVRAFDYGRTDIGPYYTMELLEGEDLREVVRSRGPLGAAETCRIVRDIASALALVHARGLVHRDLSPRNVRLVDGRAVLFDFGVLVNAGAAPNVAGTPSYVAPEMVHRQPIDGRTDLYSLGVLTYFALTGVVPFRARRLSDLEALWAHPARPLSEHADVPEALEDLVLDLLCPSPLGRPPSAAVLIDKLTSIGELPRDAELEIQAGFNLTAALVGRDDELLILEQKIDEITGGTKPKFGSAPVGRKSGGVAIEAPSGVGKSRLLGEVKLRGVLKGARTLHVACERSAGEPFAAMGALFEELFRTAPEVAQVAVEPHAPVLARAFDIVRQQFPMVDLAPSSGDPAEERMRLQQGVMGALSAAASLAPLMLLVDDVQRCDEASAAAIAGLARAITPGMLVVTARRMGEPVQAPAAVAALGAVRPKILLGGLSREGVEALLESLFGRATHIGRLAHWMHRKTGGSPLHCTELTRRLIEDGIIRYAEGSWVIPRAFDLDVPPTVAAAMTRRVGLLSAEARMLGELLAVVGREVELDRVVELVGTAGPNESDQGSVGTFASLAELQHQGVLVDRGDEFHFRHDSLQEALLAGLSPERARSLHGRVASVLLGDDEIDEGVVGWHLLEAGEDLRGAELLEAAGRRLYESQALADCIQPLGAALAVRARHGASELDLAELHFFLLSAGWVSDESTGRKHAEPALRAWSRISGLSVARRVARVLGARLGMLVGVCWANLRWMFRLFRGPGPLRSMTLFALALGYGSALSYAANRRRELDAFIELGRPFRAFRGLAPYAGYAFVLALRHILHGHLGRADTEITQALHLVRKRLFNPMSADERRLVEAGVLSVRILIDVNQGEHARLERDIARMRELGLQYYDLAADTTRIVADRYAGFEARARAKEREIEPRALQLGSWSTDLQLVLFGHPAHAFCHDVEGLKQDLAALESYVEQGFEFTPRVLMAKGELARERGDHSEASRLLQAAFERDETDHLIRQYSSCALAQNALESHDYQEAIRWGERTLELGARAEERLWQPRLRAIAALARALDAVGESERAVELLRGAIEKAEAIRHACLAGHLHVARAVIALAHEDQVLFQHHLNLAESWLRPTENPGLIALVERLTEASRDAQPVVARRRRIGAPSSSFSLDLPSTVATQSHSDEEDPSSEADQTVVTSGARSMRPEGAGDDTETARPTAHSELDAELDADPDSVPE